MYNNSKIYSIRSNNTDLIYIGSTIQPLSKRLSGHRGSYSSYLKGGTAKYCKSYNILELGDYYIELIENFSCNNKEELHKKEGEHIRLNNCVNKVIAGRTKKEYREDNKDKIKELEKKWKENNKDKIGERQKIYREDNKEILRYKRKDKQNKIREDKKKENEEFKKTEEFKKIIEERRKRKTERDKERKLNLTDSKKEENRIRHNELQKIRRTI
jgi:hypothetical protein